MKEKAIKIINILMKLDILAIIFLVPIYFSFFNDNLPFFSLDKVVLFRSLLEILVVLFFIKICLEKHINFNIQKKYLVVILLLFFLFSLSAVLSVDVGKSFWGSYWRQQGLFTYLHYLLFFIILSAYLDNRKKIEEIVNTIIISSFLVSLIGIGQWFGYDIFNIREIEIKYFYRVTSTIGQPVLLGNFLLLTIFLPVYKFFQNKNFLQKFLYLLAFVFQLLCIVFTYSRGAWLGFIGGIFIGGIFILFRYKNNFKKIFTRLFLGFFLCFLLVFFIANIFSDSYFSKRAKSFLDFKSGSIAMRIENWKAGAIAISEKPLLGYGPEMQHEVLVRYYQPIWSIYETIGSSPDRMHNEFMDLLFIGGFIYFIYFVYLLFFIFINTIDYLKEKEGAWLAFSISVSIFAYITALFFSFSTVETNVYFFLYLAMLFVLFSKIEVSFKLKSKLWPLVTVTIFLWMIFLIFMNINQIKADYYFRLAQKNHAQKNYLEMYENYFKTIELDAKEDYYKWFLAANSMDTLREVGNDYYRQKVLDTLKNILEEQKDEKTFYSNQLIKAEILSALAKYDDKDMYLEKAEDSFRELISISPFMPEPYKAWGKMYASLEMYDKALVLYEQALSVLPDVNSKKLSYGHRMEIYDFMSIVYNDMIYCYRNMEDKENTLRVLKEYLRISPFNMDIYMKIVDIYMQEGQKEQALPYAKKLHAFHPEKIEFKKMLNDISK